MEWASPRPPRETGAARAMPSFVALTRFVFVVPHLANVLGEPQLRWARFFATNQESVVYVSVHQSVSELSRWQYHGRDVQLFVIHGGTSHRLFVPLLGR